MRKSFFIIGLGLWLAAATAGNAAEPDIRRDAAVIAVEKVMPSVVNIATETVVYTRHPLEDLIREFYDPFYRRQPKSQYSLGSGVIIDEEGYVITNDHVVRRASRISVKLSDGREFECDRVATSARSDVSLLKMRIKPGEKFAAVRFAPDEDLLLGETVLALGNPFGLGGSVSRGILSSKNRRPPRENETMDVADWLQTDAAINPGNSGGPLINLRGELIGLNVAMYREGQGIGFAIPVRLVSQALSESFKPENLQQLWFGARIKPATTPLLVTSVELGSPADKAGLKPADNILRINGRTVSGFIDFNRELLNIGEQKECTLQLRRGEELKTVTLRLVPEKSFFNEQLIQQRTGLSLQMLTTELADRLGLNSADGMIVAGVDKGGPGEKAGFEKGFIITGIAGEVPQDLISVARGFHQRKKSEAVPFQVVVQRRRGAFIEFRQGELSLSLR
jgi:S1-C subfamily serine protease